MAIGRPDYLRAGAVPTLAPARFLLGAVVVVARTGSRSAVATTKGQAGAVQWPQAPWEKLPTFARRKVGSRDGTTSRVGEVSQMWRCRSASATFSSASPLRGGSSQPNAAASRLVTLR